MEVAWWGGHLFFKGPLQRDDANDAEREEDVADWKRSFDMPHRRITGAVTLAVTEEVPVTSLLARY